MRVENVVNNIVDNIRSLPIKCALAAISGGVDSTTSAVIVRKALGDKLKAIFLDTGFMRANEPINVKSLLNNLLPLTILDVHEEFYREMLGISDAEEKRIRFRNIFYTVLSKIARDYNCDWLVQGTIAPDWIETKGGIKTQHNVLEQIGIDTVGKYGFKLIEPLREFYKDQVREIARYLGIPSEIINRQPFPGPGLSIRAVGKLTSEKLDVVRRATEIVEKSLVNLSLSQWFAAAWEYNKVYSEPMSNEVRQLGNLSVELFSTKATGVKGDSRAYGYIALVRGELNNWSSVYELHNYLTTRYEVTHVVYELMSRSKGEYFVSIRAVVTEDFMTADVPRIPREILMDIAREVMNSDDRVAAVGFDVTPKPPATIEYE
ncbi:MAG: GMP synthase [Vulcanisaeta sp. AZ3]|jgi:GMP synthase (glutamine-hydrolysing)|nr:MAG: GMP synthase [Vulcanisaeta sp. AZ3]